MILHGPARSHRRPNPTLTLIIRPLHRHSQQGVHIELHDPISPGIDVDIGVVAVWNGQKSTIDVLKVLAHTRHTNQTRAPHYCSRSSRTIPQLVMYRLSRDVTPIVGSNVVIPMP